MSVGWQDGPSRRRYTRREMNSQATDAIVGALEAFRIELPTWGFANTGTRFGKYLQPAAATTAVPFFGSALRTYELAR